MPMIDVYATEGTFKDRRTLARDLAAAVMKHEQVPPLALFKDNTAAFVHDLPGDAISNVSGDSNYVRVQVLTPAAVNLELLRGGGGVPWGGATAAIPQWVHKTLLGAVRAVEGLASQSPRRSS